MDRFLELDSSWTGEKTYIEKVSIRAIERKTDKSINSEWTSVHVDGLSSAISVKQQPLEIMRLLGVNTSNPNSVVTLGNKDAWVNELLFTLENVKNGLLELQIEGVSVSAEIGNETIEFFKENKAFLIRLGRDAFKSFISLISEKKNEEAFLLLLNRMNAEDLIIKLEQNAEALKQHNNARDLFIEKMKKFAIKLATGLLSKVLLGLLA